MKNIIIWSFLLMILQVTQVNGDSLIKKENKKGATHFLIIKLDTVASKNDTIILDSAKLDSFKKFVLNNLNNSEPKTLDSQISVSGENAPDPGKDSFLKQNFIFIGLSFTVIILFIMFFIDKKNRRNELILNLTGKKQENSRLNRWEEEIIERAVEKFTKVPMVSSNSKNNTDLEYSIKDLQKRITYLEDKISSINSNSKAEVLETEPIIEEPYQNKSTISSSKTLYADAIISGEFNKVTEHPNDDTVYELLINLSTDKVSTFIVYSGAYRRVLKNADFIDGCDKQRINTSPTNLQVDKGEAVLLDSGKWQISQKAKVKLV